MGRGEAIGHVSLVQIQPAGLIIDNPGPSGGRWTYDESRRLVTDELEVSRRGVACVDPSGERLLDIHHLDHPDKEYDDDEDMIVMGFTAHYGAMRRRLGKHMTDGVAGENIVIDSPVEWWAAGLGDRLGIRSQTAGQLAPFQYIEPTVPCVEFARFCARDEDAPKDVQRDILTFLENGRRGYYYLLDGDETVRIRPGDEVVLLGE